MSEETRRIFSITEINRVVRSLLEEGIGSVWVEGEICNYRKQSSGHHYFTLKDENTQISCVLFSRNAVRLGKTLLSEGLKVQAFGELTVYEARGQYQLNISLVQPAGMGALQAKFEALKRKLEVEGLFSPENKKPLPLFPKKIGVVTSPTGAVIRDILNIVERRASWVELILNPVRVQGAGAAEEIAAAIAEFNAFERNGLPEVDVLIVGRGGGSMEDLWAFNEEIVARAIYASRIPVVSAVGHEIDFTIADFVADLRAPTPSVAAELVVPDTGELLKHLKRFDLQMQRCLFNAVERCKARLSVIEKGILFREMLNRVSEAAQRLDGLEESLGRELRLRLREQFQEITRLGTLLQRHSPSQLLEMKRHELKAVQERLVFFYHRQIQHRGENLKRLEGMLRVLSPMATLERGFSITLSADGALIHSVKDVKPGEEIRTRVKDGEMISKIKGS